MRVWLLVFHLITVVLCQVDVSVDFTQDPIFEGKLQPTLQIVVNPLTTRSSPIHDQVYSNLKDLQSDMTRFVPWYPYPSMGVAQLQAPEINPVCEVVPYNQTMVIECSAGGTISAIEFASYGTAYGSCGDFARSKCHLANSTAIVASRCVGKGSCSFNVTGSLFPDPCVGTVKWLTIQVHCQGQTNDTHWNFTGLDPLMEDFMGATAPRNVTINFSTTPDWMWVTPGEAAVPTDPNEPFWHYNNGTALRDPSMTQIAAYYARLLSWYTKGGFTDEVGVFHSSGYFYNISHWEVLNEVESEHKQTPQLYTAIYDAIVPAMREIQPEMKFVGMALAFHDEWSWFYYFLNHSNHIDGIPLDYVSFHFYARTTNRTDPNGYESFFPQCDAFIEAVAQIIVIRNELSPETKLFIDEVGVILPNDTNPDVEPFPLVYWNAAAAEFAYLFGRLAGQDVDWLGMSQLVGYPSQFPSVSMLNWTTGAGTPRYWTLQLLFKHYRGGVGSVWQTYSSNYTVFAQAFGSSSTKTLLLVNKQNSAAKVGLTVDWQNATYECVDQSSGFSPAPSKALSDHTDLPMEPYAVCVVIYPETNTV